MTSSELQDGNASAVLRFFGRLADRVYAQDASAAALPTLYAAVPLVGRSARAGDPVAAARPWTVSEELTGVVFPERLREVADQGWADPGSRTRAPGGRDPTAKILA
ncbi:hypothetical protein [Streptomyces sp. MNU76]|uniref:hypothetical protein n=1 Tax=Streptomyces sp. MNU76 TaxID=2560026 RepID=UPI0027E1B7F3|nr:hypothetical protein [Streptomyces sp. MNU76]